MNIGYLVFSTGSIPPPSILSHDHSITIFADVGALTAAPQPFDGVVIAPAEGGLLEQALRRLRGTPALSAAPIVLLENAEDPALAALIDGVASDGPTAAALMAPIHSRLQQLPTDILTHGQTFRLLAYLFCRPEAIQTPVRKWDTARVYAYPIAEALADADTGIGEWLRNLIERNYLETAGLVDRLRECPACGHAHHNYVDACPHCRSIDIVQKPFLHCFTCGHVGPEDAFLKTAALICPQCTARLRHIGSDYDRPLENQVCNACTQSFIEPEVRARCLHCGAENPTERLVPRQVHSYRLTERGRTAALTGNLEDIYALFDHLNYVRPQFFLELVDWLLEVCRRHADERFSLLGIRLSNVVELTASLGRHRAAELVDEFALRLRETVRRTDLTTRMDQRTLWLLLPKTECPACTLLLSRLEEIRSRSRQADGVELRFDSVSYSAPAEQLAGETAAVLLARLTGQMG
jgi:hypothetical protein